MAELPTGTVTFLLTDVEGSTALWEAAHDAMHAALTRHDAILVAEVERRGGVVVKHRGEGDSVFTVFGAASAAVAAAVAIQRALADEPWPTPRPIRVRIAVHSGEAQLREGDYFGPTVNRCARLRGLGHGEQTLVSEATAVLVRDLLPDGAVLVDLGEHRLRDLARPERVYQLTAASLPAEFPPLASLDTHRHNLPVQPTPLIGRQREIRAICDLLGGGAARLVTLTGPGGTGKTRLGLQVAADLLDLYQDGVFLVDLAPISDPDLVLSTIAHALGLVDSGRRPMLDLLIERLQRQRLLLVLDNFEQVLEAAPVVDGLLRACPTLSILITSRAPLQIRVEREFPVAPLPLPDMQRSYTREALVQHDAVALFVERATAVNPEFRFTDANAPSVAEICTRLDGLPLAIELAAARLRLLSPEMMLPRLGHGLALLAGGRRDLPARQQTLRSAIAWSYDLLPAAEQRLFRRLSVFVGGFTLGAAEAVADADGDVGVDLLEGLESLVSHSLVQPGETVAGDVRFRMLETIREFGLEQLGANDETTRLREHHLNWCVQFADQFFQDVGGPAYGAWLSRMDAEHDNFRAALRWSENPACDPERGLRLSGVLREYWSIRGKPGEGRAWLRRLLARASPRTEARAMALGAAGYLAARQGDYEAARSALEESLLIRRELGDSRWTARALRHLALVWHHLRDYDRARAMLEEALSLLQDLAETRECFLTLRYLADLLFDSALYVEAASLYEKCLMWAQASGETHEIGYSQRGLGNVARARGEYERARRLLCESVGSLASLGDQRCTPICLEGLACTEVGPNWAERATRLLGAAQAMQERTGAPASPAEMADYRRTAADARAQLGEAQFAAIWAGGAAMSLDDAVAYALAEDETSVAAVISVSGGRSAPLPERQPHPAMDVTATLDHGLARRLSAKMPLSAREREVVALIAEGLSNRQIAERLVLSVRTVERHIENVYGRLGISGKAGRAIVTAYALRHGLTESL